MAVLVKVAQVAEKLCIARTFRQVEQLVDNSALAMTKINLFNPPETEWVQEPLRVASRPDDDTRIRVGDEVELVERELGEDEIPMTIIESP
ncbi:hypothetical protein ACFPK1_29515 [Actinomycetospora rhizophila]|uniref:Uncharacterized protein n=1 Tax=Actinomycetospora rhizophila TaxID=1416876 RepID=A0ABV9ZM50_9PSEU